MTGKKRPLKGSSNFEYMIVKNGYFVDKSLFIKEFYYSDDQTLLITRPRRFGKTMNLSMLEHFFDIQKPDSKNLFDGLQIMRDSAFCETYQNKHPVINLSLKSVRGNDWKECYEILIETIINAYRKHIYLLDSNKLTSFDKSSLERIMNGVAKEREYKISLFLLSSLSS